MPDKKTCGKCKGEGEIEVLVSQHDDKKETIVCPKCLGKGSVYEMTDREEQDYHDNYW